jgi:hypothetical protein
MESYWQLVGMTLWDLQASSLGPSQIVYVTLNTINDVVGGTYLFSGHIPMTIW